MQTRNQKFSRLKQFSFFFFPFLSIALGRRVELELQNSGILLKRAMSRRAEIDSRILVSLFGPVLYFPSSLFGARCFFRQRTIYPRLEDARQAWKYIIRERHFHPLISRFAPPKRTHPHKLPPGETGRNEARLYR